MTLREFILIKKVELLEFENYWINGQLDPVDSAQFKKDLSLEVWEIEFQNWWSTKT